VATTSLRMTNSILSKLIGKVSCENYKRTWQGVPNTLLPYLYNRYMICANDKYTYSNVHMLFMSPPYHFHRVNIFYNIIVLDPSTIFQTYDFISCDISCDHRHMALHHSRKTKTKTKQNKIENQIKEN